MRRKVLSKNYGRGRVVTNQLVKDEDGCWHEKVTPTTRRTRRAPRTPHRMGAMHDLALMANVVRNAYVCGMGITRVFRLDGVLLLQPEFAARLFKKTRPNARPSTIYRYLNNLLIMTVGRRIHDGKGGPVKRRQDGNKGTGTATMPPAIIELDRQFETNPVDNPVSVRDDRGSTES